MLIALLDYIPFFRNDFKMYIDTNHYNYFSCKMILNITIHSLPFYKFKNNILSILFLDFLTMYKSQVQIMKVGANASGIIILAYSKEI